MRHVTQQDIANHCGVSRAAVSFALRNDPQVSQETATRIRAAAEDLGYQPAQHQAARRMILQRYGRKLINRIVLVFVPRYYHNALYYARMVEGILDTLTEADFSLVLSYVPVTHEERPASLPAIIASGEFDGAIFLALRPEAGAVLSELRTASADAKLPIITLAQPHDGCTSIVFDEEHGAYLATRHLLELGHRHMLQCFNAPMAVSVQIGAQRIAGARRAMEEFGLDPAHHLCQESWYLGNLMPEHHLVPADAIGEQAQHFDEASDMFLHYLRLHPEITAVMAQNDRLAHRIAYLLRQAGYRLPDEMSLIGFDDTEPMLLDAYGNNMLTTVRLPLTEMGRQAAMRILDAIHQRETTAMPTLPVSLVVRHSTTSR